MNIAVRNGRLLDPASGRDEVADVLIVEGKVASVGAPGAVRGPEGMEVVDARGLWVIPGLIDLHVHLREPGQEYKEDIASGSAAAAAGGFTTIVAMPNTAPPIDNGELVAFVHQRGAAAGKCRVLPTGCVTRAQAGKQMAPIAEMQRAGAVAITDDGHPVADAALMRRALEYSQSFGLPVLTHAEDTCLSHGGHMHEGLVATRLGMRGMPRTAEDAAVWRDILLAEYTGGRLHVCHVSTQGAVEAIRWAKARGVHVTAEAAPHHFALTHEAVADFDTATKMNPPLREESDRQAVIAGLADGTLDAIATDHAPHSVLEKDTSFADASFGVIGLQSALPLSLQLWRDGYMPLLDVLGRLTVGPARALGLAGGRIAVGEAGDIAVVDPDASWTLTPEVILSKSTNSPFLGQVLRGQVKTTILGGRVLHRAGTGLR